MAETDELLATAELGQEARNFLEGDLGRYLKGLAEQELWLAQKGLETVSVTDTDKIRDLQNRAIVARWFNDWLEELVDKGDSALEVIRQQQEAA